MSEKRGRRAGLDVKLGRAEMALAYELWHEPVSIYLIADALGISAHRLNMLLVRCQRDGLGWLRKP